MKKREGFQKELTCVIYIANSPKWMWALCTTHVLTKIKIEKENGKNDQIRVSEVRGSILREINVSSTVIHS